MKKLSCQDIMLLQNSKEEHNKKKYVTVDEILERLSDYQIGCRPLVIEDIIEELSH